MLVSNNSIKTIAFYLPQFHPIPENNHWWGAVFTEWTNVTQSNPLFKGHYQPQLPADLGFYDLRLPETRTAQAELARAYGIHGFCYYHYWFEGTRLLDRPFSEVLASGEPDFPFCLCWANETWSRRWLGEEKAILIKQTYSEEDDLRHAQWLTHAFADRRYIHVDGRPLFIIYRPHDLPDPQKTIEVLRKESIQSGLPNPYLVGCNAHRRHFDYRSLDFDATLDFLPQLGSLPYAFDPDGSFRWQRFRNNLRLGIRNPYLKVYDYSEAYDRMLEQSRAVPIKKIPTVFVGWDNTPRRGENAIILTNQSPEKFESVLIDTLKRCESSDSEPVIFLNAWNEWAEGNHLEPDQRNGHRYLEAVQNALQTIRQTNSKWSKA